MQPPSPDVQALLQKSRSLPPRQRQELVAKAARDLRIREERVAQADLGERGRPGGLLRFVRYFWHILEPNAQLVVDMQMEAICIHLEAVARGEIKRLLINVSPGASKSLLVNVFFPAWLWGPANKAELRFVTFAYAAYLTERDNIRFRDIIRSPEYQELWSAAFTLTADGQVKPTNDRKGWKFSSSMLGVGTGERGDYLLADDLHNVVEGESEPVRTKTVRWAREGMSNRLNDMIEGVIIMIGQRVNEDDVSNAMIVNDLGFVHLCIPMEYDPVRHCATEWWEDPRSEPMELASPIRFPPETIAVMKRTLGPYAWCTPGESPVLMGDLSMKPIGQVSIGDTVIGFTLDNTPHGPEFKYKRRRLIPAQVISISKSVRPVVKVTLETGRQIRCTADHKWYTGRQPEKNQYRPTYAPAVVGRRLMRVCDPEIQRLTTEDDLRAAGWLAGFFDGEGSAVMAKKQAHYPPSCLISFTQGADRNRDICDRLEHTLEQLGFDYGYQERPREAGHIVRWYYLRNNHRAIPMFQRFLHVVKPTKWRDRMIEGALGTQFIIGQEKITAIEPDGEETVYGLETTTGNYVVWGFASSNSAQYQQSPEPRGGGIIKRDWWGVYELDVGAPFRHKFEYILASLDPAFTAKEENDPSGFTVWGVYYDKGKPKCVLLHAWKKWLELHGQTMEYKPNETKKDYVRRASPHWGLVEWVVHDCARLKVHKLLVEDKASGHSVAQELRRLYSDNPWHTQLFKVGALDKRARAYAVQHLFADGMIEAPASARGDMAEFREWAQMVIDECAKFRGLPGDEDNLVDSSTQALSFLRNQTSLLLRDDERSSIEQERMRYKGSESPRAAAIKSILGG